MNNPHHQSACAYVHGCLLKYLRMLEQGGSVEVALAAKAWAEYLACCDGPAGDGCGDDSDEG